jgi:uncharacterized protein (TIGR02466 family)
MPMSVSHGDFMINIMPIFINFLAVDTLHLDNVKIESYCRALMRSSRGRTVSNGGGWQSENLASSIPELSELFSEVQKRLDHLHQTFEFNDTMRQVITESWININQKGHFNYSHDHPGSLFSSVYYVRGGPDKGELEFKTPIVPHTYTISNEMVRGFNSFTGHAMVIPPITGDLLIFPAWLLHRVNMSQSADDRISIAFNSKIGRFG